MKVSEITSSSSLGIKATDGVSRMDSWRAYIKKAALLTKRDKKVVSKAGLIILAAALRQRDKRR